MTEACWWCAGMTARAIARALDSPYTWHTTMPPQDGAPELSQVSQAQLSGATTPVPSDLVGQIRRAQREGLSTRTAARLLGVSQSTVARYYRQHSTQ